MIAAMFAAKVTTIGNSLGIVLPREILARLRVDKGDLLFLVESPLGFELTPYEPRFAAQMEQAERLMRAERNVLRLLVDPRPAAVPAVPAVPAEPPPADATE
jgi:putative addiction module antidote